MATAYELANPTATGLSQEAINQLMASLRSSSAPVTGRFDYNQTVNTPGLNSSSANILSQMQETAQPDPEAINQTIAQLTSKMNQQLNIVKQMLQEQGITNPNSAVYQRAVRDLYNQLANQIAKARTDFSTASKGMQMSAKNAALNQQNTERSFAMRQEQENRSNARLDPVISVGGRLSGAGQGGQTGGETFTNIRGVTYNRNPNTMGSNATMVAGSPRYRGMDGQSGNPGAGSWNGQGSAFAAGVYIDPKTGRQMPLNGTARSGNSWFDETTAWQSQPGGFLSPRFDVNAREDLVVGRSDRSGAGGNALARAYQQKAQAEEAQRRAYAANSVWDINQEYANAGIGGRYGGSWDPRVDEQQRRKYGVASRASTGFGWNA